MRKLDHDDSKFIAPLFIKQGESTLVDVRRAPWFWNHEGEARFVEVQPLPASSECLGHRYSLPKVIHQSTNADRSETTELDCERAAISYQPLFEIKVSAANFGAKLAKKAEAIRVSNPTSSKPSLTECTYGAFAGHQSPYQNTGRTLLPIVISDLERHKFSHLFCSTDHELPLGISIAQYRPADQEIDLADLWADLWIELGDALYVSPLLWCENNKLLFLNGNMSSPQACWGNYQKHYMKPHTLLDGDERHIQWFWTSKPTVQGKP